MARTDGQQLIYPGREHAILGETESGKTWLALGCAAAELLRHRPSSTSTTRRATRPAPSSGCGCWASTATHQQAAAVRRPGRPAEGRMGHGAVRPAARSGRARRRQRSHGADGRRDQGRRRCSRLPAPTRNTVPQGRRRNHRLRSHAAQRRTRPRRGFGSVHKGNALDGARIQLVNKAPFGRDMRGVSHVYVTKDRPGYLRNNGKPDEDARQDVHGHAGGRRRERCSRRCQMLFYAPKNHDAAADDPAAALADTVHDVITRLPDHTIGSERLLFARDEVGGTQVHRGENQGRGRRSTRRRPPDRDPREARSKDIRGCRRCGGECGGCGGEGN